jgi:phage FluMu gp28-like protein
MKLSQQDILKLKIPAIVLIVVVVLMALLIWGSESRKLDTQNRLQMQKTQLMQAEQRFRTSGQEKDTIIQYLPEYQRLIDIGFIGQEKRLEWVDGLRRIHKDQKLFNISYSINPQEAYTIGILPNLGGFTLNRSVMKLELNMLHEGDLITLVEKLRAEQGSTFIVRDCELTRVTAAKPNTFVPNMLGKCELDWLTLREPAVIGVSTP